MSGLATHERDSAGTAYGDGGVVIGEACPLGDKVLLQSGHVVQGPMMIVLVVGKDEDDIWLTCRNCSKRGRGKQYAPDEGPERSHGEKRLIT